MLKLIIIYHAFRQICVLVSYVIDGPFAYNSAEHDVDLSGKKSHFVFICMSLLCSIFMRHPLRYGEYMLPHKKPQQEFELRINE